MRNGKVMLKRALGGVLVAALAVGNLVACGKQKGTGDSLIDQAKGSSKDYVFRSEKLDIDKNADFSELKIVGDRVYATTFADADSLTVCSFNSDGSDVKSWKIPEAENESHGYSCFDSEGNMYSILEIYSNDYYEDEEGLMGEEEFEETGESGEIEESEETEEPEEPEVTEDSEPASDDTEKEAGAEDVSEGDSEDAESLTEDKIVVDEGADILPGDVDFEEQDDKQYFVKYDPQGNELVRIDLSENLSEDQYFTPYSMVWTQSYGVLLSSNFGIEKFNEGTGKFETVLDTTDSGSPFYQNSINLYNGDGDKVFASYWGDEGNELCTFDPSTAKFGEKSKAIAPYDSYTFFEGHGFDLYISKNDGFYGYDLAKDEVVKLLDYTFSDLNVTYSIDTVVAVSDKEFIANIPDADYNYSLYRLIKIPPEQVKDKEIITIAGNYVSYEIREKIFAFNQENPDYRIKVVDYSSLSTEEDWNAGAKQFNLDIASGNVPDIMYFGEEEPIESYINKGLFLDLMPYIQNDPELGNVEFVDNVMDAFKTGDKLYQLVPSFYIETVATKEKYLDGKTSLSLKECKDLIKQSGVTPSDSFGLASREYVFHSGLTYAGDKYIDWKNKSCNFNCPEFIDFMEFCKDFPQEISDQMWEEYDEAAYMNGTALFSMTYMDTFKSYKRLVNGTFGEQVSYIGFPNDMGENCSILIPGGRYCISSQTGHADICWDILRQLLSEEYQDELSYNFPIRQSSFDKMAEKSKEREYWIDEDGEKQYEDEYTWVNGQEVVIQPLTQEELDYVKSFIYSINLVGTSNEEVLNIIQEEAEAYFSGQKSAEEVADIIQSRVSIYVKENS